MSRKGDKAVHYVEKPFNIGDDVKGVIDWNRRLDHMQQHSGQHLITGILDREFKHYTVSWYLGEEVAYIELGINEKFQFSPQILQVSYFPETPTITQEQIDQTEKICNELIRAQTPVTVDIFDENTPSEILEKVI